MLRHAEDAGKTSMSQVAEEHEVETTKNETESSVDVEGAVPIESSVRTTSPVNIKNSGSGDKSTRAARRLAEEAQRQAGREHVGVESNVVHDKEDDATHESTRVVDTTSGPAEGRWRPRATSRVLPGGSTGDDTVMGNATAAVMNQTTANDPPQPGVNEGGAGDDTEGSLRGVPRRTEAVKCIVELKTSPAVNFLIAIR
ncbi:hypothetical protein JG687_00018307 [Phytophthora cactorum]|uniref:Uncharacterized protein n=1 Tax=Phytophthora cactorum TaxID=29920 RepID=A0A329RD82_9STRA|nr:hypothetical protein Pcac1_g10529 [Phytophthora cactorum]KAG2889395.1 hypothetical protein PC115_g19773 [Phytophthora cactorum]KAG6943677.1 hypothetical protein JG687_00018307 [Phytophthora cactorum]RAW22321.1 hypothetical protein PC110_g21238 [Phytophthora cactorum]